jgi:hypothetical protein
MVVTNSLANFLSISKPNQVFFLFSWSELAFSATVLISAVYIRISHSEN